MLSIKTSFGGPGGSRTRVQNAFTLKGLQLYAYYSALYLACQVTVLSKDVQSPVTVHDVDQYNTCLLTSCNYCTKTVRLLDGIL